VPADIVDPFKQPDSQGPSDLKVTDLFAIPAEPTIEDLSLILNSQHRMLIAYEGALHAKDAAIKGLLEDNQRLRIALDRIWQEQGIWEYRTGYRKVDA
jgi:hypothetical protein